MSVPLAGPAARRAAPSGAPLPAGAIAAAFLAAALILVSPLLVAPLPPLVDYPNHLARALILSGQAPELAPFYAPDWRPLPNLAFDGPMLLLLEVLGPYEAGRFVLGVAALIAVAGTVAYHKAVFGRWAWWPLGAALIAWHGVLLLGFVSFSIGLGLALLTAAAWIAAGERPPLGRVVGFALLALLTAFSHLFAFFFLGVLLASREAVRLFPGDRRLRLDVRRVALLCAGMLPGLWIAAQALGGHASGAAMLWLYDDRARRALAGFANYDVWVDRFAFASVVGLIGLAALRRRLSVDPGSALAAAVIALCFLGMPSTLAGGGFAEIRFAVFASFLLFAGLDVRLAFVALPLGALLTLRVGLIALTWHTAQADLNELRRALEPLPPGARVMTVAVGREAAPAYFRDQRARAILSFIYERPDLHLGALAVVERRAVWPTLFAQPGQQPMRAVGPFTDFSSQRLWHVRPLPSVLDQARPPPPAFAQAHAVWADWPQRFDYVLLLHARATPRPPEFTTAPLAPVVDTGFAALYRVLR